MSSLNLKPTHAPVKKYYATLQRFARGHFDKEGNIRGAFEDLLKHCARQYGWTLVPEYSIPRKDRNPLSVDGALLDAFNLPRGYWEAKDTKDSLEAEMKKKFEVGYPRSNILFQRPDRALLFQDGRIAFNDSIEDAQKLVEVLRLFFEWRQPDHDSWDRAASDFSERIPEIASGAMKLIDEERRTNRAFVERFAAFAELCRESINPDLKDEAVEEMLVQHLLTERIFRRIFDNPEFTRRNVIAAEIEKVIDSLTRRQFSRDAFLRELDPFYKAIEQAASTVEDYSQKQQFLNTIYERFFQSFNRKQADTHGIVYTPQPIVDFMVRSVEEILKTEFGRSLSDKEVHILDPFVGTGNFITRVMREIKTSRLPQKYKEELHCNEIMLLPYYIASMNIEHAYLDRTGEYEPFEGICLVDTFELAEPRQAGFEFMNEGNTARIRRQKRAPIFVIIGNPPYNTNQANENDQNKNRKYKHLDERVAETYVKDSTAILRNKLSDPYVKAFRFAADRIREHGGIVCFVTNNGFVEQVAFDGLRKHLADDFNLILHFDLKGNARTAGERRQKEAGNIFEDQIRVGVGITLLVRNTASAAHKIKLYRIDDYLGSPAKKAIVEGFGSFGGTPLGEIEPDYKHSWLYEEEAPDFRSHIPLSVKGHSIHEGSGTLFRVSSLGVATNRDAYVFNHSRNALARNIGRSIGTYNSSVALYIANGRPAKETNRFADVNDQTIKWTRQTKASLSAGRLDQFREVDIRSSMYRPFTKQYLYFSSFWNEEQYKLMLMFPTEATKNVAICVVNEAQIDFSAQVTASLISLHFGGRQTKCFSFYTYDADGTNRRENITDWALTEFRSNYGQQSITKREIFHYTYALLHHPEYRTRYAANLKRELPRIPFAPDFAEYARIGAALMKLHLEYEQQREYPLERRETGKLNWRVEKMSLSKDKTQLKYNDFLTLSGIPPEVYEYRLGNRSALEWVIDQYRVSTDKRSGIVNDPNRDDDPEYIVRLIGQVVTVSLETVRLVRELSALPLLNPGD
jgi:predicted helicase